MAYGLVISPISKTVMMVKVGDNPVWQVLGCGIGDPVWRDRTGDVLYVNPITRDLNGTFRFNGREYRGNGLILNEVDECVETPHSALSDLMAMIEFTIAPPEFTARHIIFQMLAGYFKEMDEKDRAAFSGAKEGSCIQPDLSGWTVIVGPGDAGELDREAISVHAYKYASDEDSPEAAFELTVKGWVAI